MIEMDKITDTHSDGLLSPQPISLASMSQENLDELKGYETWKHGLVRRRKSWCCQRLSPWLTYLFVLLFISSQAAIISILRSQRSSPQLLGEMNGLVPNVVLDLVKFEPNPKHQTLDEDDASWLDIMPIGGGFVTPKNKNPNMVLPPPIKIHGNEIYSISVFHQLHCLHSILEGFNNVRYNRTGNRHGFKTEAEMVMHMEHCFDYLRQSIMCCGDSALEGQSTLVKEAGTSGQDSYHMCKNYEQLTSWAEANRASNQRGYA